MAIYNNYKFYIIIFTVICVDCCGVDGVGGVTFRVTWGVGVGGVTVLVG